MKVLVVGGGGREHAIIWKIKDSKNVSKIYCAPGNAGISEIAECVNIASTDINELVKFAKDNNIDFTIVGMDDPLVMGIVDEFEKNGLKIFGPHRNAAIIEGSKAYSKEFMKKYNIPTAKYEVFNNYDIAFKYVKDGKFPIVIKADGLALGKGVIICNSLEEAEKALKDIMINKKFGDSGNRVVIEEFLQGHEVSILSFCDGDTIVPMVSVQDHKRALDGDKGLNTGGMGTFTPSKYYTNDIAEICMKNIFIPTVKGLNEENRKFKGIIFFGLMITDEGPKVIEYNARFGDPETQVVLPRLKSDLMEIFESCVNGTLDKINIEWENNAAVCIVAASGGYPEAYKKGYEITGIDECKKRKNTYVFHAGTICKDGKLLTNGGRVIGVTAIGKDINEALETAYSGIKVIKFNDMYYRKDIGNK